MQAITASKTLRGRTSRIHYPPPAAAALHMATHIPKGISNLNLLDPHSGTGILAAAACETAALDPTLRSIHIDAWEPDPLLSDATRATLETAATWLAASGINLTFNVTNHQLLDHHLNPPAPYHFIIAHPPYHKLPARKSADLASTHRLPISLHNAYAAFMAITLPHLTPNGRASFLVPRSFMSGQMFIPFREHLFSLTQPTALHLFDRRDTLFKDPPVLQETLIITLAPTGPSPRITISHSDGPEDLGSHPSITLNLRTLIPADPGPPVPAPLTHSHAAFLTATNTYPHRLSHLGFTAATGPIMAFRHRQSILGQPSPAAVPFITMKQVHPMTLSYKTPNPARKTWFQPTQTNSKLLTPPAHYVLTRRFSPKEQTPRIIAAPLTPTDPPTPVAVDNGLNLIRPLHPLTNPVLITGLAAFLNSTVADLWAQLHIGNTQVGVADLHTLPVPEALTLEAIANHLPSPPYNMALLNETVHNALGPQHPLHP